MKSTQSERLNALKEIHRFTDQELGDLLGLTQPAARNIRMGLAKLTVDYANLIANKYNVNRSWLLLGEGSMNNNVSEPKLNIAEEAPVPYGLPTEEQITNRFVNQLRKYKGVHSINTIEFSEKIKWNHNHITKIINGHNQVSISVLRNAALFALFNINYTLTGSGSEFISDKDELKVCREKCQMLQELNSSLNETLNLYRDKKSDKSK